MKSITLINSSFSPDKCIKVTRHGGAVLNLCYANNWEAHEHDNRISINIKSRPDSIVNEKNLRKLTPI